MKEIPRERNHEKHKYKDVSKSPLEEFDFASFEGSSADLWI